MYQKIGKCLIPLAPLLLLLLLPPTAGQAQGEAWLHLNSYRYIGEDSDGKAVLRLFLMAYQTKARQTEWQGPLINVPDRIVVEGGTVNLVKGPLRLDDRENRVPLLLLLAVDVSGSMGGQGTERLRSNYQRRGEPLKIALNSFIKNYQDDFLYMQLMPWGHEIPFDISVVDSNQNLSAWLGRYRKLDLEGQTALLQGVSDIDTFIRQGERSVHTALYGAYFQSLNLLNGTIVDDPVFQGAKPVIILLTDGKNDPQLAPESLTTLDTDSILGHMEDQEAKIPIYSIGFAVDDRIARQNMKTISQASGGTFESVRDGGQAATKLANVYNQIVKAEGNSWYVDISTGLTRTQIARDGIRIFPLNNGEILPGQEINDRMLLFTSASVELIKKNIAISLGVIGLLMIIMANLWYFTRPKESSVAASQEENLSPEEVAPKKPETIAAGVGDIIRQMEEEERNG